MNNEIDSSNFREVLSQDDKWRENWEINATESLITHCTGLIFKRFYSATETKGEETIDFTCLNLPSERDQEFTDEYEKLIPQVVILFSEFVIPKQSTPTEIHLDCDSLEPLSSDEQNKRDFEINQYKDHLIENDYWRSQWTLDLHDAQAKHSNGLVYVLDGSNIAGGNITFRLHCIRLPHNTPEDFKQNPLFHEQMQNLGMQALILLTENLDLPGFNNSQLLH